MLIHSKIDSPKNLSLNVMNITTKQSHKYAYTIIILLFLYVVGSMARPEGRGLGLGPGLKWDNNLRAGPRPGLHNCCGLGPGPQIIFADRAWA